ncbi:trypsin-like peptidase domain-containing protein [Variovorax sp. J22R133]|uniref:S1C family serine protease n=1 Tax=Variovorax brevis TaxID=3053503 RepID=UPI002574C894|nr:trypsin-like peptidase domain-containing protein [Variovorax sp. J22R133]MDM0116364.1 trypsin-like peptidase domain-containing protein [Variovorax sp. J22R133]
MAKHLSPRSIAGVIATAALGAWPALVLPAAPGPSCADRGVWTSPYPDFVAAVAREAPTVVSLVVTRDDAWDVAGDVGQAPLVGGAHLRDAQWAPSPGRSMASGFIVRQDGEILTNAHAVAGARDVWVRLEDERRFKAEVIGLDKRTDIALLKIAATGLPVAAIAESALLCAGEWVAALGSPLGLEQSVSAGVVSASLRYIAGESGTPLIQTDVALSPGSSGGPLFNRRGEVVGMNSMLHSTAGNYAGVSLSLPIDLVLRIAAELRANGHVSRSMIGAHSQALSPELAQAFGTDRRGALVGSVDPRGPAALAGVRTGDVLTAVNGVYVKSYAELQERIASTRPGTALVLGGVEASR